MPFIFNPLSFFPAEQNLLHNFLTDTPSRLKQKLQGFSFCTFLTYTMTDRYVCVYI